MPDFEIVPFHGIGPIHFGMTIEQVHTELGAPEHVDGERHWFLGGFGVDFDDEGHVEFIELAQSAQFRGLFAGQPLHQLDAEAAVELVSTRAPFDHSVPDLGHSYIFPDLQLSLWRPHVPAPDQQANKDEGRHFHAVGIGVPGYFES